jgi:hypothetical protein
MEKVMKLDIEFLPRSKAIDAGREADGGDPQIHWRIALRRNAEGKALFTSIFSQGIAHHPLYAKHGRSVDGCAEILKSLETGKHRRDPYLIGPTVLLVPPAEREILSSLALDASAIDFSCFEEWANEYGYDADSRKALAMYQECVKIACALRQVFSNTEIQELRNDE